MDMKDPVVILTTPDGHQLVELTTPQHLKAESAALGHCVGTLFNETALAAKGLKESDPAALHYLHYVMKMRHGESRVFSLRNPRGNPLVTIEYDVKDEAIRQIEGKGGD